MCKSAGSARGRFKTFAAAQRCSCFKKSSLDLHLIVYSFYFDIFLKSYIQTIIFTINVGTMGSAQIPCRVHRGLNSMGSVWLVVPLCF